MINCVFNNYFYEDAETETEPKRSYMKCTTAAYYKHFVEEDIVLPGEREVIYNHYYNDRCPDDHQFVGERFIF